MAVNLINALLTTPHASTSHILGDRFVNWVNVKDYGAVGDGVTDDTVAIQAALNSISGTGGGSVWLEPKRYLIDSANLTIPNNCRLRGEYFPGADRVTVPGGPLKDYSAVKFALILNPSHSIIMGPGQGSQGGTELSGLFVLSKSLTVPHTLRDCVNLVAGFSGTGITIGGDDAHICDVMIIGFNVGVGCLNYNRLMIERLYGDCTNGIQINGSTDTCFINNVEITYYATINNINSDITYAVSAVANASGLTRLTIASHALVTGDTVNVYGTGIEQLTNRWTVTVISSTQIDLQGSIFGSVTKTANVTANQGFVTVTDITNIGVGQTVTGTGIPASTTVTAVSLYQKVIYFSKLPTATNASVTLTFTNPAYVSGGTVEINTNCRRGTGLQIVNATNVSCTNIVMQGFDIGYHLADACGWARMVNCSVDNLNPLSDPQTVGIWIDTTSFGTYWNGYVIAVGTAVRCTSFGFIPHQIVGCEIDTNPYSSCALLEMTGPQAVTIAGCGTHDTASNIFVGDSAVFPLMANCYFPNIPIRTQINPNVNQFNPAAAATGLTATGSSNSDAFKLAAAVNEFTTVAANSGCILPSVPAVLQLTIANFGANALNIYPNSSLAQIDRLGANVAATLSTSSTVTFVSASEGQWYRH